MWALKFLPDYRHLLLFKKILVAQYVEILKLFVVSRETFCVRKFNYFCSQSQQDGYLFGETIAFIILNSMS